LSAPNFPHGAPSWTSAQLHAAPTIASLFPYTPVHLGVSERRSFNESALSQDFFIINPDTPAISFVKKALSRNQDDAQSGFTGPFASSIV